MKSRCLQLWLVCCVVLGLQGPAQAGAWLRGEGEGFLSLSVSAVQDEAAGDTFIAQDVYLEYGLRPRLTLGAKLRYETMRSGDGQVFLRFPLREQDRPAKLSAEVGLGAQSDGITLDPFVHLGVSWGRGLRLAQRDGWANIDASVQLPTQRGNGPRWKLDATLGLTLSERFQIMGQAFFETDDLGDSLTLTPSFIYRRPSGARWVLGLSRKSGRGAETGLKLGIWKDF